MLRDITVLYKNSIKYTQKVHVHDMLHSQQFKTHSQQNQKAFRKQQNSVTCNSTLIKPLKTDYLVYTKKGSFKIISQAEFKILPKLLVSQLRLSPTLARCALMANILNPLAGFSSGVMLRCIYDSKFSLLAPVNQNCCSPADVPSWISHQTHQ